METEKLEKIRQSVESLAKTAETLVSEADGFPAILQNTRRLKACLRMMEMALGQVTMTPGQNRLSLSRPE
ncbi:MAG: hypothetical protein LJE96_01205 [Deltaproteobacteria bacterium]|nr:hypothetical protein [Deltaproteobacteria bacterium]